MLFYDRILKLVYFRLHLLVAALQVTPGHASLACNSQQDSIWRGGWGNVHGHGRRGHHAQEEVVIIQHRQGAWKAEEGHQRQGG